jgi:hypothetical protein
VLSASETLREFFTAAAATAGTLIGLLFVALSVERGETRAPGAAVIREVRTSAALLAFSNALTVSLFSLVPGTNPGYPSLSLSVIGLLFIAAAVRSILTSESTRHARLRQFGLMRLLVLIFGTELIAGIVAVINPRSTSAGDAIGYALVASLLVGVGRAWELVGDRDTGVMTSLAILAGREPPQFGSHDSQPHSATGDGSEGTPGT